MRTNRPILATYVVLLLAWCRTHANGDEPGCAPLFGQCGGLGFSGPTCCVAGAVCVDTPGNPYYSQCKAAPSLTEANASPPPAVTEAESPALAPTSTDCSPLYGQCGGATFVGPTCCAAGTTCVERSQYYSQCVPGASASLPAAPLATPEGAPLVVTTPAPVCYTTYLGFAAVCDACRFNKDGLESQAADSVDACKLICTLLGWGVCRSVTYAAGRCWLYGVQVEEMGAHGYRQEAGATLASQCAPPASLAKFPDNPIANLGVDWSKLCLDSRAYELIPNQLPSCGSTCKLETGTDLQVQSADECAAICVLRADCACAYYEKNGWCDLYSVTCQDPDNGAYYNNLRTTTAVSPCREHAVETFPGALDDYDTSVDWHGLWDDLCESDLPSVVVPDQETFCGPACHLLGTATEVVPSAADCASRCLLAPGCASAFFAADGRCSLKSVSWRDALAWDTRETSASVQDAIVMCSH